MSMFRSGKYHSIHAYFNFWGDLSLVLSLFFEGSYNNNHISLIQCPLKAITALHSLPHSLVLLTRTFFYHMDYNYYCNRSSRNWRVFFRAKQYSVKCRQQVISCSRFVKINHSNQLRVKGKVAVGYSFGTHQDLP